MSAAQKLPDPEEPQSLYNIEIERAVLGLLLMHNEALDKIEPILVADCFYEAVNRKIYEIILDLTSTGKPAHPMTVKMCLSDLDLGEIKPNQYLARLAAEATSVINGLPYAKILVDLFRRRKMIDAAEKIKEMVAASSFDVPVASLLDRASGMLDEVQFRNGAPEGVVSLFDAGKQGLREVGEAYEKGGAVAGKTTGIPTLDRAFGGLSDTDVVIIAARPGIGKTALAVGFAESVARTNPGTVGLFFSQEMSAVQLATRQMSKEAKIPAVKLRNGEVTEMEYEALQAAQRSLAQLNILIDGQAGIKLSQIATRMRQVGRRQRLSLVVVDYLQLMAGSGKSKGRGDNRNQELSEITAGLKSLAKEFNVPMVVLSQLSRKCEERDDKRPMLSDLRDSGSIEQDADVVMMLYREEYYLLQNFPRGKSGEQIERWHAEMSRWKGLSEVIIAKNRHGPQGTYMIGFDADLTSFRELDDDEKHRESAPAKTKLRITNAAARATWDAIKGALDRLGLEGRSSVCPPDAKAITYQEGVGEMLAAMPALSGDDPAKIEKRAREEFRDGVKWLKNEGAIKIYVEQINGVNDAWIWLGDRGVRR